MIEREHLFGERAGVRADEAGGVFGKSLLHCLRECRCADHIRRAGIRILAVHDKADEARVGFADAFNRLFESQPLGAAVENSHAVAFGPAALSEQQRPCGRLDRGVRLGQRLVGL